MEAVWFLRETTEQLPETRRMTGNFITEVVRRSAADDLKSAESAENILKTNKLSSFRKSKKGISSSKIISP